MLAAASTLPPTGPVVLMGKVEVCLLGLGAVHEKSPLDDVLQLASAPLPPTNPFVQVGKVEKFLQPACLKKIHVMLAAASTPPPTGLQHHGDHLQPHGGLQLGRDQPLAQELMLDDIDFISEIRTFRPL